MLYITESTCKVRFYSSRGGKGLQVALVKGNVYPGHRENIRQAAEILRAGGLVAFPTETVYGLGAAADNPLAVGRIFSAKGRPLNHPLIVHLANVICLDRWAREIPPVAWNLAEHFWPGPLTLILKRSLEVPDLITGGQDTIGLRIPGHPVALSLLEAFGGALAAPSANRFGHLSPTAARDVAAELGDEVDYIIDGGECLVGIESTILDLSASRPRILRPGIINAADLAEVLGELPKGRTTVSPRVPGDLPLHYAPRSPLFLAEPSRLEPMVKSLLDAGQVVTVLSRHRPSWNLAEVNWRPTPGDPLEYARRLYSSLREVDSPVNHSILVEAPPMSEEWEAVRDRLFRAAKGNLLQEVTR